MSELMTPIPFWELMTWITTEYQRDGSVFGVRPYRAGVKKLSQHSAGPKHHRRLLCRCPVF